MTAARVPRRHGGRQQREKAHYADAILPFDEEIAQIWGRLRVLHAENPLDKQIAATALMYSLTVVTRKVSRYEPTGDEPASSATLLMPKFNGRRGRTTVAA